MKKTGIFTDSHSSIPPETAKELGIGMLPAPFSIDGEVFYEGIDLSREEFFHRLEAGAVIQTSQPAPGAVMELWDRGLEEYSEILYLPMSSGLSGSCASAKMLAEMEPYAGRVFVVDNGRISTPLHCTILDALAMVEKGMGAEEIRTILEKYRAEYSVYVAIDTLEYLKRGGRLSAAAATVATVLNIKPIIEIGVGDIEVFKKSRGMKKARQEMLETVKHDLETRFAEWYRSGDFYLMTATSVNEEENRAFIEEVQEAFPGVPILSDFLSLGTCAHVGYGGLGVGVSCKLRAGKDY